jgi:Fe-S-cluster containining protein
MDPLSFRCTGCGNCCRALRVAVTASDVARLTAATSKPPIELVEWLAPGAVDMTGEPESFIELSEGRRLMVLAQAGGACRLLDASDRCTAYAARPLDCQAFPFDFERGRPDAVRLRLLPLSGCDHARDGRQDNAALEAVDAQRWRELSSYQQQVGVWNRLARHRRRLGHRVGSAAEFLAFALGTPSAHSPAIHSGSASSRTNQQEGGKTGRPEEGFWGARSA